jgi:aspartyl-tRNA(Asn)/glutamyl-tRNA(Gln) amidotransferase subunit C
MHISDELIDHLATLSKLRFEASEKTAMRDDFQRMLDLVAVLTEVDTTGVAPLIHMTEAVNHLRLDQVEEALPSVGMLDQAPDAKPPFFSVPKVIEQDASARDQ